MSGIRKSESLPIPLWYSLFNFKVVFHPFSFHRCARAFNSIRREYCLLRSKFQVLMQLERRIVALETSQQ
ncbi:hypothetical protein V6N13_059767 [Hibiscus sabdariffa]|uniref:Uncharacterized protein n=1 Tax=Hibiscus sabdariffa TaxID=183260 RepID=A0ABR2GCC3_9ROSI